MRKAEDRIEIRLPERRRQPETVVAHLGPTNSGKTHDALAFLAEHLGFTAAETVACGDGENDVELLEWAGYGVAVANAHERVLAVADLVCPPVTEEGVAQVIEAYLDSLA